jgi:hypothetical protein
MDLSKTGAGAHLLERVPSIKVAAAGAAAIAANAVVSALIDQNGRTKARIFMWASAKPLSISVYGKTPWLSARTTYPNKQERIDERIL